jgi:hypothetical protein
MSFKYNQGQIPFEIAVKNFKEIPLHNLLGDFYLEYVTDTVSIDKLCGLVYVNIKYVHWKKNRVSNKELVEYLGRLSLKDILDINGVGKLKAEKAYQFYAELANQVRVVNIERKGKNWLIINEEIIVEAHTCYLVFDQLTEKERDLLVARVPLD